MAQAVVYLRPGSHPARRRACTAAADRAGLTIQCLTTDAAEARRLRDAGYTLVCPPECVSDVLPDVVVPPPRQSGRDVAPVVLAATGAAAFVAWLWRHKAATGAVAAGALTAVTGLVLLPQFEPYQPPERPSAVAPPPPHLAVSSPPLEQGAASPGPVEASPEEALPAATSPTAVPAEGVTPPPAPSPELEPPPTDEPGPSVAVLESPPAVVPSPTLEPPPLPEVDIGEDGEEDEEAEEDCLELEILDLRLCPTGPDG